MLWNTFKLGTIVVLATVATAGVGRLTYRVAADGGQTQTAAEGTGTAGPAPVTPPAHELDLLGMSVPEARPFGKPAIFASVNEWIEAFPDKKWHVPILKQADFRIEQLLLFSWTGAAGDELWFTVEETATERVVVYHHYRGHDKAKGRHAHLFSQSKEVGFRIEESNEPSPPPPLAHEIDLTGYAALPPMGGAPTEPTVLTSAEELAKAIADKDWQQRLAAKVDFAKERLLFFAWWGWPGERLRFTTLHAKDGPVVVFHHTPGNRAAKGEAYYSRLFAVSKEATWRAVEESNAPVRKLSAEERALAALGMREIPLPGIPDVAAHASALEPTPIANADELANAIGDKEWAKKVAEQVDFGNEKLVLFLWSGSVADRLWFGPLSLKSERTVVFHYYAGQAEKERRHVHLFAFASDFGWKVQKEVEPPPRAPVVLNPEDSTALLPRHQGASGGPVEVLRAEATVTLHGVLAHTPKGVFLLVKEGNAAETKAWELDVSKFPELDQQAKELSGKAVVATGICQMVRTRLEWELQKVVVISKLAADK